MSAYVHFRAQNIEEYPRNGKGNPVAGRGPSLHLSTFLVTVSDVIIRIGWAPCLKDFKKPKTMFVLFSVRNLCEICLRFVVKCSQM